ncbi:hypothetical protein EDB89DRAFT_839254 [Lactarius sanguifluus]|nr:hypothetical protein EDB89DRAFT_839254 [Lactarius sanguifluus]
MPRAHAFSVFSASVRCRAAQLPFWTHSVLPHAISTLFPHSPRSSTHPPARYLRRSTSAAHTRPASGSQAARRQAMCPRASCCLCPSTPRLRRTAHLPLKLSRRFAIVDLLGYAAPLSLARARSIFFVWYTNLLYNSARTVVRHIAGIALAISLMTPPPVSALRT